MPRLDDLAEKLAPLLGGFLPRQRWYAGADAPSSVEVTPIELRDGDETSPPLSFTGVPAETAELAVVVRDPDADGFVHWVVAGIPPEATGIDEGAPPADAVEADNGFDEPGWAGPCPPEGDHTYEFTVYALAEPSTLESGASAEDGARTIEDADALAVATLRGTFERG